MLNSGNANAATGERGPTPTPVACAPSPPPRSAARPSDVLVCSPGSSASRCRSTRWRPASPPPPRPGGRRRGGRARAADAIRTTDTVPKEAARHGRRLHRRRHGEGRRDARPGDGHHARRRSPPTRRSTPPALDARAALPCPRHVQRAHRRRVHEHERHRSRPRQRPRREPADRVHRCRLRAFADALTAVCDGLAEQMAADAEGATKLARVVVPAPRRPADARRAARGVASSQLVQCSLYGADPYWGRVLSELGASGAQFDPEQRRHRLQRRHRVPRRRRHPPRRRRARRRHGATRHRDPLRPPRRRRPRPWCASPTSPTPTSTRTAAPHDRRPRPRRARRRPRCSPRPSRTSGEFAGSTVVIKYGGHAMEEPGLAELFAARRRPDAPRRHEPRRRARRRPPDQRPHAPPRQGARVRRRPAGHRRRHRRHRPHGPRRQGEPGGRHLPQPARLVRRRPLR